MLIYVQVIIYHGTITALFKDVVSDAEDTKYDLQMKVGNISVSSLSTIGQDYYKAKLEIFYIDPKSNTINFSNVLRDINTGNVLYTASLANLCTYDVEMKILNKDGTLAPEGNFIFSAYDLDIPTIADKGYTAARQNSWNNYGKGWGLHSEGIDIGSGFDTSKLEFAKNGTFLRNLGNYRIRGSRIDSATEFSEFVIPGSSSGAKFTWVGDESCVTQIFSYYQPMNVEIEKQNESRSILSGAKLELYYQDGTKVAEWETEDTNKILFLNPGQYRLHEVEAPSGYDIASDVYFYVDIENTLTQNGRQVNKIVMRDPKRPIPKYPYTIRYKDKDTGEEIKDAKTGEKLERNSYTYIR